MTAKGTPWKVTHSNHPCTRWTWENIDHWTWLWYYGQMCSQLWKHETGKRHGTADFWQMLPAAVNELHKAGINPFMTPVADFKQAFATARPWESHLNHVVCIAPDKICRTHPDFGKDPVTDYRLYIAMDKNPSWDGRKRLLEPEWHKQIKQNVLTRIIRQRI